MPSMTKFFHNQLADLAMQLERSPRRLRLQQLQGVERLLALVESDRTYPFDFICFHITGYRKRGAPDAGPTLNGRSLIDDLVSLAEVISRKANLTVGELGGPYQTHEQVAVQLGVSTKTIRRWRSRGLMGLRVVFEDGVNRLAFLKQSVDRFVQQNEDLVRKGASFKQLSTAERKYIVDRARDLVSKKPIKLHAAARIIATETGRAVETVRYTLRRFDEAHREKALFNGAQRDQISEREGAICRALQAGEPLEAVARAFDTSTEEITDTLRAVTARTWVQANWDYMPCELFDAPNADALVLEAPEPEGDGKPLPRPPRDVPSYLQSLYQTPLLTREQEYDLFRRYNYVKFKIARAVRGVRAEKLASECYEEVRSLTDLAENLRQRIIRANLRLVVSIAKRHVGVTEDFFEVVSDGNMSLMRAAEKFDFTRGYKFSTYATWAIVKNYARSIPEQRYLGTRYVTGQDELLESAADHRELPALESDRTRVRELIDAGLSELTEREREILRGHFGLQKKGGAAATLEELGRRLGVTKERVRQIEQKALARLREVLSPRLADSIPE
jgi:RNA polymerase sigma factor (sigma-70 family)